MKLNLKNIGKISEAEIYLEGITVICGENDTGKSTVGKAMLAFCNSLYNCRNKVVDEKTKIFTKFVNRIRESSELYEYLHPMNVQEMIKNFIITHTGEYTIKELQDFLRINHLSNKVKEQLSQVIEYLNVSDISIINEYALRNFNSIMNNQVKNVFATNNSECFISVELDGKTNTINVLERSFTCDINTPVCFNAHYINNPDILDLLNSNDTLSQDIFEKTSVINSIITAQINIENNPMTNIIDKVNDKKSIKTVKNIMKPVYKGDIIKLEGKYYYCENDVKFDIRNISAGLKSFAIIERLLETGTLNRKDVLIIDTPEMYLNPEWQIIYAEMLVMLQKTFDLKILLITHSVHFWRAIECYTNQYETMDRLNIYSLGNNRITNNSYSGYGVHNLNDKFLTQFDKLQQMIDKK